MLSQQVNSNLSFTIWLEKISGKGEDAFPIIQQVSINDDTTLFLIGVFDGMGGRSPSGWKDKKGHMHSGAFYASRIARDVLAKYFMELIEKGCFNSIKNMTQLAESFSDVIFQKLKIIADKRIGKPTLRGTLFSRLATTAAFAILKITAGKLFIDQFWIGDSRIYLLSPEFGLLQLTKDDTKVGYPNSRQLFVSDAPLSKFFNGDKKFLLNYNHLEFELPCIVFACTDGCYGYWRSPMDFEYQVLNSLMESSDLQDWKQKMKNIFQKIAGDDASMSLMTFGWREFNDIRADFKNRQTFLQKHYIEPLDLAYNDANSDGIRLLWSLYRISYEKHIKARELLASSRREEAEY